MKRLCEGLIWLYPPSWRRRYGREFQDLLGEMSGVTAKDAVDTFAGAARMWADMVWRSTYGLELTVAFLFFLTGIVNAFVSRADGNSVWRSSAVFMLLAAATMLVCAATGFLATRRGASVWRSAAGGFVLTVSALLIPAAVLMAVSAGLEATAPVMPFEQYPAFGRDPDPGALIGFSEDLKRSREWFVHWGRAVRLSLVAAVVLGTVLAWLGGMASWMLRRLRVTRMLAVLFVVASGAQGQWPAPRSAMDAYEFVNQRRVEAGKLWAVKDPKGLTMLEDLLGYLRQPLVADLAAGNRFLAARRENILMDMAEAYALASRPAEAIAALRQVARALPSPDAARFIASREAFGSMRSSEEFGAVLAEFRRYEKYWDSAELASPYRDELSEAERIAGLSKFWSEVKYNFGYPEKLVELGWDRLYLEWIPKVQATRSTEDYYRQLMLLCARLTDGHTNIIMPSGVEANAKPPLRTALIGGRVMIVEVFSPALERDGIVRGLEIVKVDGEPAIEFGRRVYEPYQSSSTPGDRELRVFSYDFLRGAVAQPVRLTLRNAAGEGREHVVARSGYADVRSVPPFEWNMLEGDVALVTLRTFGDAQTARRFVEEFPKIRQSKAVILDLRWNGGGSSGIGYEVLRRFIEKPVPGSRQVMRRYSPTDRARGVLMEFSEMPASDIQPAPGERFAGPVAVLTSAATFSAAEDFLVAWKNSGRGPVIGSTSGGSTGQPLFFSLPGGGSARVCTKKDTFPDGREWVGKGIEPDIVVAMGARAFLEERDTVVERAVAHLLLAGSR